MTRQWVILGQHKEPLHEGSGLRHRRTATVGTAERRAALDIVEAARWVIAFSSFDRRSSHSPGRLNRLQEVGRAPIRAPASTNAGTKTSRFGRGGCGIVASAPTPVHPGSHAQLPEKKGGVCVTASSAAVAEAADRAPADQPCELAAAIGVRLRSSLTR
jgi:hypothetical protein